MKYLAQYEDFLLKNASQITGIEGTLRSLTYILPGRFHDAELASQGCKGGIGGWGQGAGGREQEQ
ncbi:hypothetical protein BX666DRAFT_2006298 [Dichotomocladium elegans]|nr:hypothetical protein BX666DRAFT_2006298 [Dichotomocladium elegans]